MKPIGTKTITTERLILRAPQLSDAQELRQVGSLAMSEEDARRSVEGMIEELKHPFCFHWVITLNGRAIGRVKAWEVSPYNGYLQLGYDVGVAYSNQGYMTEAVQAVLQYMFLQADANRVYCSVREENAASRRVCEKNGMMHEGVLREHYARQDGGYDNVHLYGILRREFIAGGNKHGN